MRVWAGARTLVFAGILAGVFVGIFASQAASAAALRANVIVAGAHVRLSDLFSGLFPGQDSEIGDAPALGENFTLHGAQLTAIAAQFGVDWPEASPFASITLTRAARMVGEGELVSLLRKEMAIPRESQSSISLDGYKPVALSPDNQAALELTQFDKPPKGSGHFTARFEVPTQGGNTQVISVTGTVATIVTAVTLRRPVRAGTLLLPEDLTTTSMRSSLLPDDALHDVQDAVGMELRTNVQQGQALAASALDHPQLLHRGSPVVVSFSTPSLHLTVSGAAMEAAGKGDVVHVFNPNTHMILMGRVVDRTEVDIIPGVSPISADSRHGNAMSQNMPLL